MSGELALLVDGRPLPNRQAFVEWPAGKEQKAHQVSWTVELPPGKHQLSVLVRSKDDTPNVSNLIEIASPLPPGQRPRLHHLAIGINAYDHDVSACLLRDGELAFAIGKERVTRKKHATKRCISGAALSRARIRTCRCWRW